MARTCTICTRTDRHALDLRLAQPDCNLSALAREVGLSRQAVARHRDQHLARTPLLGDLTLRSNALGFDEIHAQAQALYLKALETLAVIEAGEDIGVDKEGRPVRSRSMTQQLKAIREVRGIVELLAKLAVVGDAESREPSKRVDLDASIERALERVMEKRTMQLEGHEVEAQIEDAEVLHSA